MILKISNQLLASLLFALALASTIQASEIANITLTEQSLNIEGNDGYTRVTLTVSGPDGFYVQNYFGDKKITMAIDDISSLSNGTYQYELTASIVNSSDNHIKQTMNNGRNDNSTYATQSSSQNGSFIVNDGKILISTPRSNKRMNAEGNDHDQA